MWSASGRTCPFILQRYIVLEFFLDVKRKYHGCYVNFALDQLDLFPNKTISRACKKSIRVQESPSGTCDVPPPRHVFAYNQANTRKSVLKKLEFSQ